MEEAVRAAVRFAAERAAETEREDVREIERLLAAFAAWADIGDENELFQNFKYLWHFVAAYGEAAEAPHEISPFKKHPQVL
ncbi:hypothetical protein [Hominenteromicrobium sp.]